MDKVRSHNRVHIEERPFKCETCDARRKTKAEVTSHQRVHSQNKPYPCELCGKAFKTRAETNNHVQLKHTGKNSYPCKNCTNSYLKLNDLKKHIIAVHVEDDSEKIQLKCYLCDLCNEEFTTEIEWKNHKIGDKHRFKLITVALNKSIANQ